MKLKCIEKSGQIFLYILVDINNNEREYMLKRVVAEEPMWEKFHSLNSSYPKDHALVGGEQLIF